MWAQRRLERDVRLRWVAVLLACVLGLAITVAAHSEHAHKHAVRGSAVLAVATIDNPHSAAKGDSHSDQQTAPAPAATARWGLGTADSSPLVSSGTADAPPVRGPPAEAA
jgi:hypothetical protein